ncbi:uncharacterized protein LOC113275751 isoform X2 [Papaver somniferum]|uniref:uncharacterized protein LOC113275751 isoform X2 n=1 Tax=Papaver somniferum TaxID=3469 RepID=UPI000E6F5595|nr:uncharacterized protein LOC113275751 isoform X2 [Papaver somniferum]
MEAGQLIEDNEIIGNHRHEDASDFQGQKSERDESPLETRRKHIDNLPRLRDLMDMEDREDVRGNQLRVTMPQNIVPVGDISLFEKEKNYAQKNATQCEVPEMMIVYLKETSNHAVNIRFDDKVPSCDKTAVENKEANHSSDLCFSSCTSDVHSDLIKEIMEDLASNSDAMGEHDTKNLMEDGEGKLNFTDGLGSVSCSEKFVTMDVLPVRKKEMDILQFEALDDDEDMQQSGQDTYEEVNSSSSSLFCAVEAINCGNVEETSSNVYLESDSFTINPGSSPRLESDISGEQTHSELVHALTPPAGEDSLGELRSASSRSILTQHGQGESSFSALDNPAALVTRSGRIAYSGSISLRLQADWHTSPVRMAKADRRHYRKHQRWKLSLLCCKF